MHVLCLIICYIVIELLTFTKRQSEAYLIGSREHMFREAQGPLTALVPPQPPLPKVAIWKNMFHLKKMYLRRLNKMEMSYTIMVKNCENT